MLIPLDLKYIVYCWSVLTLMQRKGQTSFLYRIFCRIMKIEQEREASTMTAPAVEFSTEKYNNLQIFVELRHIFKMRDNEKRKVAVACKYNWFQYGWRIEVCLQPHTVKSRILAHLVLEAHTGFFRLSVRIKFYVYLLRPFGKKKSIRNQN